jgi:hypothetical protein
METLGCAGFWGAAKLAPLFRCGTWFFAALSAIGALLNFASQSRWENFIFGPLALVLTILCIVVARSAPPGGARTRKRGWASPSAASSWPVRPTDRGGRRGAPAD